MEPSMNEAYKQLMVDYKRLVKEHDELKTTHAALLKKVARSKRKK